MRIGIDLMGSDSSSIFLFEAVLQAAEQLNSPCSLLVIATQAIIDQLHPVYNFSKKKYSQAHIEFHTVAETIAMADDPLKAIRHKKEASLLVGMRLLKKKSLDAFVSCGNTGALITSANLSMPMLPGIKRPALLASLPSEKGPLAVLDVGANLASKASSLVQFAYLGAAYQKAMHGIDLPRVGLLNIGLESKKGTIEIRQTYEFLKKHSQSSPSSFNFVGNIEGRDVFKGFIDVLVTDGFSGNVLLKASEGMAAYIFSALSQSFTSQQTELTPSFNQLYTTLQKQFDYTEYPGAIVCGIDGILIKVHGNASVKGLFKSILFAAECVQKNMVDLIKIQLKSYSFNN